MNTKKLRLNQHVSYIDSKFLLRYPLGKDPIVVTGSANFSNASTNDENMIMQGFAAHSTKSGGVARVGGDGFQGRNRTADTRIFSLGAALHFQYFERLRCQGFAMWARSAAC